MIERIAIENFKSLRSADRSLGRMNLFVHEDLVLNGHILKPLAGAVMMDVGRPAAKVDVLDNPRLREYDHVVWISVWSNPT